MAHFASLPGPFIELLRAAPPFALAFSGGLDSRFLAHAAVLCGAKAHLYHIRGPHVPEAESADAAAWAKERELPFTAIDLDPLAVPEVRSGGKDRCYGCKRHLFQRLGEAARADGFALLCDGSNASDQLAYRPGIRALQELGVRSPLAEAGLDKAAVRRHAKATGMDRPDQQARPCLLTRYAYGLAPDAVSLAALAAAEKAVGEILAEAVGQGLVPGPPDFRLRLVANAAHMGKTAHTLPFVPELHLSLAAPDALVAALADAVEASGFARPALAVVESLSGHYDRAQP